ncbi:MAG: hypothetical protein P4N60_11085, partial [Verrucomicrobiae bacterium]|nr:hypothetical protein [Verrucomicrobiae bacterium]
DHVPIPKNRHVAATSIFGFPKNPSCPMQFLRRPGFRAGGWTTDDLSQHNQEERVKWGEDG